MSRNELRKRAEVTAMLAHDAVDGALETWRRFHDERLSDQARWDAMSRDVAALGEVSAGYAGASRAYSALLAADPPGGPTGQREGDTR